MTKRYVYDHGLPFSECLVKNLNKIKNRTLNDNKASLIIIDGGVGEGKTTFAVEIADFFMGRNILFSEQLAMGGKDFLVKLRVCYDKKLITVIYDEAGDFDKRGALSRFNALLNRIFDTFRAFKIIVIVCLPNFYVLDSSLYDKKIPRLLLHLSKRNNSYGNFKGYSLYRMNWLRFNMDKYKHNKDYAYERVGCNLYGQFLDLPPARSKELDAYSVGGKLDILSKASIDFDNLLCYEEISQKIRRSIPWIKNKVSVLKLKPDKVYKRKNYFHNSIIDRFLDIIDSGGKK